MKTIQINGINLHYREDGAPSGPPVVFANSLGTDLRLWDDLVALMPPDLRLIRYDKRGHGLSDCPPAPYAMGALIRDAEGLLEALGVRDCVFVGLSIGGMIAQGLAAKRLDLVRAVVLSNTAPKIGTREMWEARIAALAAGGMASLSEAVMERWFSRAFREGPNLPPWKRMVETTPVAGYAGCSAAIAGTDFYTTTAALRLPALVIAGDQDGSTPPDLVREMADLIPGARFEMIRGAGHLPCVEQPRDFARLLTGFLADLGLGLPDAAGADA